MFRTRSLVAFLSIAWMASAAIVSAQEEQAPTQEQKAKIDPTGTWKWQREFGDVTMHFTLRLKLQDGKLTGTLDTLRGEEATEPAEIEEAKLEGDKITFSVTRQFNDNEFTIDYDGTVKEDAINGLIEADFGGNPTEFEWQAKRGLDWKDVLGEWKLAFETPNGNTVESLLRLTKEGEAVKGTITSDRFGEQELKEIAIKDAQLTFAFVGERDGNEFRLNYTLSPRGDATTGKIQFGENADRSFEFSGKRVKEEKQPAGTEERQE